MYSSCVPKIIKMLAELQPKNGSGFDKISLYIAKVTPKNILHVLSYTFNLFLVQGKFINAFKKAKVIPVHKKGFKIDTNNYKPIRLLPVMFEILKKIFYEKLFSFFNRASFFYQHRFGSGKNSTNNALTIITKNFTRAFEDKKCTMSVF